MQQPNIDPDMPGRPRAIEWPVAFSIEEMSKHQLPDFHQDIKELATEMTCHFNGLLAALAHNGNIVLTDYKRHLATIRAEEELIRQILANTPELLPLGIVVSARIELNDGAEILSIRPGGRLGVIGGTLSPPELYEWFGDAHIVNPVAQALLEIWEETGMGDLRQGDKAHNLNQLAMHEDSTTQLVRRAEWPWVPVAAVSINLNYSYKEAMSRFEEHTRGQELPELDGIVDTNSVSREQWEKSTPATKIIYPLK